MKTILTCLLTLALTITTNQITFASKKTRAQQEKKENKQADIHDAQCPVCFERAHTTTTPAVVTKCGHIFCKTCHDTWLAHHNTCPVCRKKLTKKKHTPTQDENQDLFFDANQEIDDSTTELEAFMNRRIEETHLTRARNGDIVALEALSCSLKYSSSNTSALHIAAKLGTLESIQTLIDLRHASINERNRFRWTPLHYAAQNNRTAVINWLLDHDADIDAVTTSGMTALHVAADVGSINAVKTLIDRGAKIDTRDAKGHTPRGSALDNHNGRKTMMPFHYEIARMLQEARKT